MAEVLVTFQNKKNPEMKSAPIQIPAGTGVEEMEKVLNLMLEQEKAYAFFYEGKRIDAVPEVDSREQVAQIDYITVSKLTMESALLQEDSPVTALSVRQNQKTMTDSVIVCTLNGSVHEYTLTPGMEAVLKYESYTPIRGVTSTEEDLYIVTVTNKVVDVQKEKIVFEEEVPIRTICLGAGLLAIGLDSGEVVVLKGEEVFKKIRGKDAIGRVFVRKEGEKTLLIFGTVSGTISIYDTETWEERHVVLPRPLTTMGYFDGTIYAGGVGGIISLVSTGGEKQEKEIQSDETFLSRIEAGTTFVGYVNKNRVMLRDKETFTGTHKLLLGGLVSDMKINSKQLIVSEGNFVRIFNVFDE
jgi:NLE (NUC135) domain